MHRLRPHHDRLHRCGKMHPPLTSHFFSYRGKLELPAPQVPPAVPSPCSPRQEEHTRACTLPPPSPHECCLYLTGKGGGGAWLAWDRWASSCSMVTVPSRRGSARRSSRSSGGALPRTPGRRSVESPVINSVQQLKKQWGAHCRGRRDEGKCERKVCSSLGPFGGFDPAGGGHKRRGGGGGGSVG